MVRHTTYAVHLALVIVGHPQHIGVELSLMGFWNGGYAFAGTHNNMVQCTCVTHVSSNVWQPFLLRMLRLSRPFGTRVPSAAARHRTARRRSVACTVLQKSHPFRGGHLIQSICSLHHYFKERSVCFLSVVYPFVILFIMRSIKSSSASYFIDCVGYTRISSFIEAVRTASL